MLQQLNLYHPQEKIIKGTSYKGDLVEMIASLAALRLRTTRVLAGWA